MKKIILFKIFVFLFITLFCALGTWQLYRLQWKQDLINQIAKGLDSTPIKYSASIKKNYQRVELTGKYKFDEQEELVSLIPSTNKKGNWEERPDGSGRSAAKMQRGRGELERESFFLKASKDPREDSKAVRPGEEDNSYGKSQS